MTTDKDSLVERLREPCRDYSGEMIVRDSTPRDEIHCGLLYDAADLIERQSKVIEAVAEGSRCAERGEHGMAGKHFGEAAFLTRTLKGRD